MNQAGNYAAVVTNAFGVTNSSNAFLTVNPLPPCDSAPVGIVGWWQAENNTADIVGTNNAVLIGKAGYTNGFVGQAFRFSTNGDQVKTSTGGFPIGTNDRTMECWVYFNSFISGAESTIAGYGNFGGSGQIYEIYLTPSQQFCFSQWGSSIVGPTLSSGQWYHLAVTSVGTNVTLYVNGASVANGGISFNTPSNTSLYIGGVTAFGSVRQTAGQIDEVSIYNRALSPAEIAAIYNAGNAGKCPLPPGILIQPANQIAATGSNVTFKVIANGSLPLSYHWTFNGTNITGATNASLVLTNVQPSQSGIYAVSISNLVGSITSSNAGLTLTGFPYITTQPASQTNYVGTGEAFTVIATGTTPLQYQWKFNGTNINAATNTLLSLPNLQFSQAGNYSVSVTNSLGGILSSNAALVVVPQFHFVWNQINSPRFVGAPFTVVIQAFNTSNILASNFVGVVNLLSTNGIPVTPSLSGSFNNGTWVGKLTIAQPATNVVLEAVDAYGEMGLANTINVVSRPGLSTATASGNLYIFWPINPSGFVLETSSNLAAGSWVGVMAPPIQIGNQYLESVSLAKSNSFYRLRYTNQ